MSHSHASCCEHEVAWCRVCDAVYCKKCGVEWRRYHWTYSYHSYTYPFYGTAIDGDFSAGHQH
jgi:hypothetical protein